jgi:hypothetical protein
MCKIIENYTCIFLFVLSYSIMEIIYLKNYTELIDKINELFKDLGSEEVKNMFFFLNEFNKEGIVPDDARLYITEISTESLEVISKNKVSSVFIGGTRKYVELKYPDRAVPPVVVVKGNIRLVIVYGESFAIESYMKQKAVKAIVIDIGDRDVFEVFNIIPEETYFLVPLVQKEMKKSGIPVPEE